MKILFVIPGLQKGGAELFLLRLLTRFDEIGVQCSLISLKDGPLQKEFLKVCSGRVLVVRQWWNLRGFFLSNKFTLIQGWMYSGDLVALLIGVLLRKPVIVSLRNGSFDKKELARRWVFLRVYRSALRLSSGLISCSRKAIEWHESVLKYRYQNKIVIPNGYIMCGPKNMTLGDQLKKNKTVDILLVGRNHPQKNYSKALEVLEKIAFKRPALRVLIVGDGVSKLYSSNKNFEFKEHVDQVHRLIASSRLLVSFSRYGEAFPNVLVESLLMETPFVSYDTGEARLIAEYGGWIMDEFNEEETILDCLDAPSSIRRDKLDEFNINNISERYLNYYEKCVE